MKRKRILTVAFVVSLLPMLMNQYGGMKGVQEISGLINLFNPIGMLSVVLFFTGVWFPFKKEIQNSILSLTGLLGIVISEIYQYLTWHILTITGEMSLQNSINLAFPWFYFGLVISLAMIVIYFAIGKVLKD